jgi:alcohol dehydrogenase (cytochrome c)
MRVSGRAARYWRTMCFIVVGAVAGGALSSMAAQPAPKPAPVSGGPFTEAQAARGKAVYTQSCAACHGATLGGGTAPALTGPSFEMSWGHPQLTLDDLFYIVRTTMPPKAASSVTAADHAAVFAYLVPKPGEPGYETWQNPKGIPMGGGAVWTSFSLDTSTGDLYVPVTNPSPDLPVQLRKGDNLYTNSIVCLDVRTGKRRWHRSLVPNDSHDWDVTHASPLITATVKGASRRLVATAGKDGMLRTLDRETHEVLYETPLTTIENATAPVTTTPSRVCPGVLGGVEWSDPAYLPGTNMIYTPAVDWCTTFAAYEEPRYIPGHDYLGGSVDMDPTEKAQGWVTAVDASTGEVKWKYRSTRPMVASVTATAGNLLLTGELSGNFLALDARSGTVLYRFNTGGAMGGGVVTYAVEGTQYIAAVSGTPSSFWVDQYGGSPTVVVFKLQR